MKTALDSNLKTFLAATLLAAAGTPLFAAIDDYEEFVSENKDMKFVEVSSTTNSTDEDESIPAKPKARKKNTRVMSTEEDEVDDDEEYVRPKKTEFRKKKKRYADEDGEYMSAKKSKKKNVTSEKPEVKRKTVAIFVRNDSNKSELDDAAKQLEFALSAELNNGGFSVINHDLVVRNLNDYLGNPNAKYRKEAKEAQKDGVELSLFERASGLRMCEFIGADYIISVSFQSLGESKKKFSGYGIKTTNIVRTLRSNYNIYEGGTGAGTAGGVITSEFRFRESNGLTMESDDVLNGLIADAASQMASKLHKQNKENQIIAKNESAGEVRIIFVIEAMSFPEIKKDENGEYIVTTNAIPATIPYVTAEIDGVAQTIGGTIKLSKGLHTFYINQKDIEPIEKNIFVSGKKEQVIMLSLSLTDEARKRWKDDMEFMEKMKDRARESEGRLELKKAEAERMRGFAEALRNSHLKIDMGSRVDVKAEDINLKSKN